MRRPVKSPWTNALKKFTQCQPNCSPKQATAMFAKPARQESHQAIDQKIQRGCVTRWQPCDLKTWGACWGGSVRWSQWEETAGFLT